MHLARSFGLAVLGLLGLAVLVQLVGRGGLSLFHVAGWLGASMPWAAFVAGIAASRTVLRRGPGLVGRLSVFVAVLIGLAVATFLWVGWITPSLASAGAVSGAATAYERSFSELVAALGPSRPDPGDASPLAWVEWNRIAFASMHRVALAFEVILIGWIGLSTGYWSRFGRGRALALAQCVGMALFLLVSRYLTFENAWELFVLKEREPADALALAVLVVPALLAIGLSWPTLVVLGARREE